LPASRTPFPRPESGSKACPSGSPVLPNAGVCEPCAAPAAIPFVSRRTAVADVTPVAVGTDQAPARLLARVPAVRAAWRSS
ncbi:MAG: hypothetical protein MUE60_14400, partial [Candidatus Eisenbacteria bacterium]|nr:hypothetical protein [Candidatus Eisenbacteria bacterium]